MISSSQTSPPTTTLRPVIQSLRKKLAVSTYQLTEVQFLLVFDAERYKSERFLRALCQGAEAGILWQTFIHEAAVCKEMRVNGNKRGQSKANVWTNTDFEKAMERLIQRGNANEDDQEAQESRELTATDHEDYPADQNMSGGCRSSAHPDEAASSSSPSRLPHSLDPAADKSTLEASLSVATTATRTTFSAFPGANIAPSPCTPSTTMFPDEQPNILMNNIREARQATTPEPSHSPMSSEAELRTSEILPPINQNGKRPSTFPVPTRTSRWITVGPSTVSTPSHPQVIAISAIYFEVKHHLENLELTSAHLRDVTKTHNTAVAAHDDEVDSEVHSLELKIAEAGTRILRCEEQIADIEIKFIGHASGLEKMLKVLNDLIDVDKVEKQEAEVKLQEIRDRLDQRNRDAEAAKAELRMAKTAYEAADYMTVCLSQQLEKMQQMIQEARRASKE